AADSQQDLRRSGRLLADLLARVAAASPGVPIDVVAHSQGGIVARLALATAPPPATVRHLVTLGTPHGGANLASAAVAAGRVPPRREAVAALAGGLGL